MSTIHNPVVRGVAPDPSICRVGDDFFLATSTFDLMPGVRIRHSTDLVNWRIIGAAVTRPAQYRRDARPGPLMLFAPTLRHHAGQFYVACTNVADDQGNFIVNTGDPAGDWSDAAWVDTHAFDPSLLFADGTCYYSRRTLAPRPDGHLGPVVQAEIDARTGEFLSEMRELTPDYGGFSSNDIEGPHLYKIGEWYYLYSAEGGSWKGHMQTCARSRSPWGPFEPCPHNPVLTHRHRVGHKIQCVGHSDLVDAPDGSWWAVMLGTRHLTLGGFIFHHNLGRETFLAPVRWVDGWPVIGDAGRIDLAMELDRPLPSGASSLIPADTIWNAGWSTVGLPDPALSGDPATGRYEVPFGSAPDTTDAVGSVGLLLQPQQEDNATFTAVLDVVPTAPRQAGVVVYTDRDHYYALLVSAHGDTVRAVLRRQVDDLVVDLTIPVDLGRPVDLRIEATPERYTFLLAGAQVGSGSARLLSSETTESFVGCHFGLVAVGDRDAAPAGFSDVQARWQPADPV